MSYTYLLEWGEESSAECFSTIPAYVLSRLNLTADRSYCSASETDVSPSSQSGMMSEPLTENHGVDSLPRSHGSNDGMADRVERTKAIGNGQSPSVARLAWNILN